MTPFPGSPDKTRDSLLPKLALKPWIPGKAARLVLRDAYIVDPAKGALLNGRFDVTMDDGVIVELQPTAERDTSTWVRIDPEDPPTIDVSVSGKFLCPGLIDCHVHVTAVPGVNTMAELVQTPEELVHLRTTYVLREMLMRGFTTVRDTGGASKALATAISEGLIVLKAVREELKGGADFIKVMCGGGVASPTDAIETVQFTAEELCAITTTCKQMGGKHTTAHAYTDASVLHAIENGVRGIEHGNLISRETAKLMAERGIFLTPTLACYGIMVRLPFEDFLPPEGKVKNKQVMARGLDALKIADEAGVTICYSVLSSVKVLRHATTNAALMLGDPRLGSLSVGSCADILVLDANPLEDVTVLDYPEKHLFAVIQGGRVVSSRLDGLPSEHI
ncbi:hypothetical protein BN946_scf185035.g6 [Trametes cinnabarina]|uniref:Amidohydrolase-related domain-containing protein n=1 Tax=Pycnoporus cinnabarinus TaxID=5643 RepID=A0A060S905_PYCCI|nr:hypothetical protein BN946_scf185035.g6 [Trametes cinnabarina]